MKKYFFLIAFLLLSSSPIIASAQDKSVIIHANAMQYEARNNTIQFNSQVFIETAEFYLWADKIIVYLSENTAINSNAMAGFKEAQIQRIEAIGNVSMEYGNTRGWGGKAMYDLVRNVLSLQEKPMLEEGDNSIVGDEILYYIDEEKSEIVGGQTRVRAVFSSSLQDAEDNAIKN